jgi:hypothetical protein
VMEVTRMVLGASQNWDHTDQHQGEDSYQDHLEHRLHDPLMTRESQSQFLGVIPRLSKANGSELVVSLQCAGVRWPGNNPDSSLS